VIFINYETLVTMKSMKRLLDGDFKYRIRARKVVHRALRKMIQRRGRLVVKPEHLWLKWLEENDIA